MNTARRAAERSAQHVREARAGTPGADARSRPGIGGAAELAALTGERLDAFGLLVQVDAVLERAGVPADQRLFTGSNLRLDLARAAAEELVPAAEAPALMETGAQDPWSDWISGCLEDRDVGAAATDATPASPAEVGAAAALSVSPSLVARLLARSHGPIPEPYQSRINALLGGGAPLDDKVQARFSAAMGHDLGHVRVHIGGEVSEIAAGLHARAFTVGADVFFGAGEYAPGSDVGDRLLAHELTHVVQHDEGRIQHQGISSPDASTEQEARASEGWVVEGLASGEVPMGEAAMGAETTAERGSPTATGSEPAVQRQEDGARGTQGVSTPRHEAEAVGTGRPPPSDEGVLGVQLSKQLLMAILAGEWNPGNGNWDNEQILEWYNRRRPSPPQQESIPRETFISLVKYVTRHNSLTEAERRGPEVVDAYLNEATGCYEILVQVNILRQWFSPEAIDALRAVLRAAEPETPEQAHGAPPERTSRGRQTGQRGHRQPPQGQDFVHANWDDPSTRSRIRLGPGDTQLCRDVGLSFVYALERMVPAWRDLRAAGTFGCPSLVTDINREFSVVFGHVLPPGTEQDPSANKPRLLQLLSERPQVLDMLCEIDALNDGPYTPSLNVNLMGWVYGNLHVPPLEHRYTLTLQESAHAGWGTVRGAEMKATLTYQSSHGLSWTREARLLRVEVVAGVSAGVDAGVDRRGARARRGDLDGTSGPAIGLSGGATTLVATRVTCYFTPDDLASATGRIMGAGASASLGGHIGPLSESQGLDLFSVCSLDLCSTRGNSLTFTSDSNATGTQRDDDVEESPGVEPELELEFPSLPSNEEEEDDDDRPVIGLSAGVEAELYGGYLRQHGTLGGTDYSQNTPHDLGTGIRGAALVDAGVVARVCFASGDATLDDMDRATVMDFCARLIEGRDTFRVRWSVAVVGSASATWRGAARPDRARALNRDLAETRAKAVVNVLFDGLMRWNLPPGAITIGPPEVQERSGEGLSASPEDQQVVTLEATPVPC